MTQDQNPTAPAQNHDPSDDAEGHFNARWDTESGFRAADAEPGFVVDTPHANQEDDAEGHLSGALRTDPAVPSAAGRPVDATHPKADEPEMF